jgi:hypothetical protein
MRGLADTLVLFMLAAMFCRALVSKREAPKFRAVYRARGTGKTGSREPARVVH